MSPLVDLSWVSDHFQGFLGLGIFDENRKLDFF